MLIAAIEPNKIRSTIRKSAQVGRFPAVTSQGNYHMMRACEPAPAVHSRTLALTLLAMLCFAGNSLLCRAALLHSSIDAASFTTIRIVSGALVLWLLLRVKRAPGKGNWISALALFMYAATFSFAYRTLSAGTGALLLFGAVQITMIGAGLKSGETLLKLQWLGLSLAITGLVVLLLPGLAAPPMLGALLMLCAGIAWGVYSLRGRGTGEPLQVTAGNFVRAALFAFVLSAFNYRQLSVDIAGASYALASGALTSGVGYAIWYAALPQLNASSAATVQLSVPVIAAFGGALWLAELPSLRLIAASLAILGGIALVLRYGARNSR